MTNLLDALIAKGDLAHLALLAWALAASFLVFEMLRQNRRLIADLTAATRRFDAFVRALARFNRRVG